MADQEKLRRLVQRVHLMTPRQRGIVEKDKLNLQHALQGQPMPFYGGDPRSADFHPSVPTQQAPAGTVLVLRDMPVPDRAQLERNYQACNETLDRGTAPDFSVAAKNTMYQWYKEDRDAYQEGMPSHEEMWRPLHHNLMKYQKHKAANKERVKRLKNIHYILDPHDEDFHLEMFRPEKPKPYNGEAYRAGWDDIDWESPEEMARQVEELDDETYYRFVEFKAQGITAPKIYEMKLGITMQLYRACEARLKQAMDALDVTQELEAELGHAVSTEDLAAMAQEVPPDPEPGEEGERLTEKESECLELYGNAVLTFLQEHRAMGVDDLDTLLQGITAFPNKHANNETRKAVIRALQKAGMLRLDGHQYVLTAGVRAA